MGQLVGGDKVKSRGIGRQQGDKKAGRVSESEETADSFCVHCLYWVLQGNCPSNSSVSPKLKPDVRLQREGGWAEGNTLRTLIF
jgi:hypothetical protein